MRYGKGLSPRILLGFFISHGGLLIAKRWSLNGWNTSVCSLVSSMMEYQQNGEKDTYLRDSNHAPPAYQAHSKKKGILETLFRFPSLLLSETVRGFPECSETFFTLETHFWVSGIDKWVSECSGTYFDRYSRITFFLRVQTHYHYTGRDISLSVWRT